MSNIFSSEEISALKQFRLSISDIIEKYDEYDAHDNNLIRWLRARDLNLKKAEGMIRKSTKYRQDHPELQNLQYLPVPEDFLEKLPFRPIGHDKEGILVVSFSAQNWEFKKLVLAGRTVEMKRYVCHILERFFRHNKTISTPENINNQMVVIMDLLGFSIPEHLSKPVISFALELLRLLDLNYPEIMKTVYIINVPKIFPVGWSIISPFLSQRTINKFKIIGGGQNNWKRVLLEDIDYSELPSEYGGSNTVHPTQYTNEHGESWPSRSGSFPQESFLTTVVPAKKNVMLSFQLVAGNRISWNFKTDSYDIGFEFKFNDTQMFPSVRADSHLYTQDGLVDVTEDGTYTLVFDNSYSKYRSKTLHYAILVEDSVSEH
ncbi:unnamed protein product [Allacma fusca]|uniref:CRAL-TRIO domain-containing protein n=1 Tax=Allacma fusca TaxID=39272 RepID=A0A8J2KSS7_9HEXA|nr:unnamed protein product [Allacma fusca]